jgi:hypothetical protein
MRERMNAASIPAPRGEGLIVEPVGDETVVYDLETKDAHCLKPLAAFVFGHVDGRRTVGEIASLAPDKLSGVTEKDVISAIEELQSVALLEQPPQLDDQLTVVKNGVGRREMLKRMAFAGAAATAATTMVTTIAAPSALAACTGQQGGCACTQNKECSSGHCCQNVTSKCNPGCCATDNNGTDCQCNTTTNTCNTIVQPAACCLGFCNLTGGGKAC